MWPANPATQRRQDMNHLWSFRSVFIKGFLGSIVRLNCIDIPHSQIQEGKLENKKEKKLNLWLANKASFHILHLLETSKRNAVVSLFFWSHIDSLSCLTSAFSSTQIPLNQMSSISPVVHSSPAVSVLPHHDSQLLVIRSTCHGCPPPKTQGAGTRHWSRSQEQGCRFTWF